MPAYDELILLANRASSDRPELRRFLTAVEKAPPPGPSTIPTRPGQFFKATDPMLDDELNRRAWADTAAALRASARRRSTMAATSASPRSSPTAA